MTVDGEVDAGTATISGSIEIRSPGFDASAGATIDHGDLTGRDEPDQHPASAIDVDGTPLDTVLDNVPLLDAANMFTAKQSIDVQVPVTPIADIATTKPTILARLHGGDGAAVDLFAITASTGGSVFKTAGVLTAVIGFDGQPTGDWIMLAVGAMGPGFLRVTSSDPDLERPPFIGDLFTGTPEPLSVGTPTADGHATTKAYVDANGGVALGETSSTAYRGDRGKTAYDHSQVVTGNPHGTTAAGVGAAPTSHTHAASDVTSGTLDIARIPTGTTGSTVPFGNDSRFTDKVPLSTVDAAGDLLIGTANDTVGRLPIGTARKVLTSDGTTAAWANAGGPSPAMYPVAVGQWFASPHEAIFAQATTLNRVLYVPVWVPADVTAVDGIQIEVTTVGSTGAVVRLGLHLPHATTKFPDARVIDGGTVDATSGGGAAGVRSLTIASTAVTPNSLIYVSVVSQGATATLRYANSGLWLLAMGVPSATNTDCMKASSNFGWFEAGVSGGFGTTASPTYSSSTAAQVVVGLRRA